MRIESVNGIPPESWSPALGMHLGFQLSRRSVLLLRPASKQRANDGAVFKHTSNNLVTNTICHDTYTWRCIARSAATVLLNLLLQLCFAADVARGIAFS